MRLRKLAVQNVRGLRELILNTDDKSIVLVGPNGAGKSSVVDAVDFLLTGSVQRLQGVGAGSLSLAEHGKHVDALAKDAWVEATFVVEETGTPKKPLVVRRTMKPSRLDPTPLPSSLADIFDRAERLRHHLLSRREILKFIMARPGDRREQISALLDIESVESQRKELSAAAKDAAAVATAADERLKRGRRDLLQAVNPPASDAADMLTKVNERRGALGVSRVAAISGALDGVQSSGVEQQHPLRTFETTLRRLITPEAMNALGAHVQAYVDEVSRVAREGGARADAEQRLIDAGRELLESDVCPLCRSTIAATLLRPQLDARHIELERIAGEIAKLRAERSRLVDAHARLAIDLGEIANGLASITEVRVLVNHAKSFITPVLPHATTPDVTFEGTTLRIFGEELAKLVAAAIDAAEHLPKPSAKASALLALQVVAQKAAEVELSEVAAKRAKALAHFTAIAEESFVAARDETLDAIHTEIAARVEALYGRIHGDGARKTSLTGTKTGLEIEVDFHGRGRYPPSALHSEGQQDTLGICLFLALAERASSGPPPLLILDDVLMSIDAEHRRAVATMLKAEFPSTQFIITTHDQVWARQLKGLGVVGKEFPFSGWTIDHGHSSLETNESFKRMRAELAADHVPTAAHTLRHTLETVLPEICDAIGAQVRFRKDQQHELGDFFGSCRSKFAKLITEGIKARESWQQDTAPLTTLSDDYRSVADALEKETWAVNKALHYNEWLAMNANDFGPVVDAYERFLRFFSCTTCECLVKADEDFVQCPCTATTWPLKKKGK